MSLPASRNRQTRRRAARQFPAWALVLIDIFALGAALIVFALFDHVVPREVTRVVATARPQVTPAADSAAEPLGAKFADKFTRGEVVVTDTSYASANLYVELTARQVGGIAYYVQDIYLRDIGCLRAALANDIFGKGQREEVGQLAQRNGAIGAINGDYYNAGVIGVVIRDGVLYSDVCDIDYPACVLFRDGTVGLYDESQFDAEALMAAGAWQGWQFGPSLIRADLTPETEFSDAELARNNPRTALGYYEPGHYCFIVVDGRQEGYSEGITLADLAALGAGMGLQVLYNLDGGGSSQMVFQDALVNRPAYGGRECADILYVTDVGA